MPVSAPADREPRTGARRRRSRAAGRPSGRSSLPGFRPAGRLHDFFALVEGAEDDDAALTCMERRAERLLRIDGFRSRMDRSRPPPVSWIRKAPTHVDHASRARFGIPNDDGQQSADAIGDDFVVAALAFAATAFRERLRESDNFAPGRQGRELPTHGGTLPSPLAIPRCPQRRWLGLSAARLHDVTRLSAVTHVGLRLRRELSRSSKETPCCPSKAPRFPAPPFG